VICKKQKPHRVTGRASKNQTKETVASNERNKAILRAYCKPGLALASRCKHGLASAYKGPFTGWWGRVTP
jgi:hypothetical protein